MAWLGLAWLNSLVKPNLNSNPKFVLSFWTRDLTQIHHQVLLFWMSSPSFQLIKWLVRYEFIFQVHNKLITKFISSLLVITKSMNLNLTCFLLNPLFMNNFFSLSLTHLSNKSKIKVQIWFVYKQTNMNELFIEQTANCLWMT